MPFTHNSQLSENVMLGYWKMTESPDELLSLMHADAFDAKAYEKLLNDKARKQWLSARLLLKEMCGDDARIVYEDIYFSGEQFYFFACSHNRFEGT